MHNFRLLFFTATILLSQLSFSKGMTYILKEIKFNKIPVLSIAFSPDNNSLLCGLDNNNYIIYNLINDKNILEKEAHRAGVKDVHFLNDNTFITAGDKTIKMWDIKGEIIKTFTGHNTYIWMLDFSSNNTKMVSGSYEKYFSFWDINLGNKINTVKGHGKSVLAVSISPDNKYIASGSLDKTIKLWDFKTQELIHTFEGHAANILCLKFSPDGKYLLSASLDNNLKIWDVKDKVFVKNLMGHNKGVMTCDFSPNSKFIISGSIDNNINLWNTKSTELIFTFSSHENIINDVTINNKGNQFASASNDGKVILWEVKPEIFVYYYYADEFYSELEDSRYHGEKRKTENNADFKLRQEKLEKFKLQLIQKYYSKYLESK